MLVKNTYSYHKDGTVPTADEIFVFGSNQRGLHGAGAATVARLNFGAVPGYWYGLMGHSYAIATKDRHLRSLGLVEIEKAVGVFCEFTHNNPEMRFFVTRVGCGYAGYRNSQMAPLFKQANINCSFAESWEQYL